MGRDGDNLGALNETEQTLAVDADRTALSLRSGTWHYGLLARWWAEFNHAEASEVAYYQTAIAKYGEPAIDLGCGAGRLLVPLISEGLEVDGVDVSSDMIAAARSLLPPNAVNTRLLVQPLHKLDLDREYGTAFMCGVLGIGGRRDWDQEALIRVHRYLRPGGALLINHALPYNNAKGWADGVPGHHASYPEPWPEEGHRKETAAGDAIELLSRVTSFDPLKQLFEMEMLARLWRNEVLLEEESYVIRLCLYFAQEVLLMLRIAGFKDVAIEGNYTGQLATGDDGTVIVVATK
ncbi:MAG TPA: class I SAM-dependent methyltransferase [Candidatus Dormibacteraeota bacterium]|nr:class I SAM-dependent methyltransferase [Candidatus Dormibacteraeota bacterium]